MAVQIHMRTKGTVQNSMRMQMNASFCRELDPSKFHSSLEIPTIFPTFNTVSGKLCKTLLRLASCHFKLHVSLVQKTKQSKYSVQISFLFFFICEYFLYYDTAHPHPLLNEVPKKYICQSHLMIQSTDSVAYIYIFHVPMYIQSIFKELKYITNLPPPLIPLRLLAFCKMVHLRFIFPQLRDYKAQWILLV